MGTSKVGILDGARVLSSCVGCNVDDTLCSLSALSRSRYSGYGPPGGILYPSDYDYYRGALLAGLVRLRALALPCSVRAVMDKASLRP